MLQAISVMIHMNITSLPCGEAAIFTRTAQFKRAGLTLCGAARAGRASVIHVLHYTDPLVH
jgi:hypothetical protein